MPVPRYTGAAPVCNSCPAAEDRAMAFELHPTTIRSVLVAPLNIPLLAPFGISGGAQESAANVSS